MSIHDLFIHEIKVVRAPVVTDRRNDAVRDWANATRTTARGWIAQAAQSISSEQRDGTAVVSEWTVVVPADTDINAHDRVEWDGRIFDVIGEPNRGFTPSGAAHHKEVQMRIVEG